MTDSAWSNGAWPVSSMTHYTLTHTHTHTRAHSWLMHSALISKVRTFYSSKQYYYESGIWYLVSVSMAPVNTSHASFMYFIGTPRGRVKACFAYTSIRSRQAYNNIRPYRYTSGSTACRSHTSIPRTVCYLLLGSEHPNDHSIASKCISADSEGLSGEQIIPKSVRFSFPFSFLTPTPFPSEAGVREVTSVRCLNSLLR